MCKYKAVVFWFVSCACDVVFWSLLPTAVAEVSIGGLGGCYCRCCPLSFRLKMKRKQQLWRLFLRVYFFNKNDGSMQQVQYNDDNIWGRRTWLFINLRVTTIVSGMTVETKGRQQIIRIRRELKNANKNIGFLITSRAFLAPFHCVLFKL